MICPRCRRENAATSAFCTDCGAPLRLREEPAPRPLAAPVPLDRRTPDRRPPPPPVPRGRVAPREPEPFFAPPAGASDLSYWDLGTAAAPDATHALEGANGPAADRVRPTAAPPPAPAVRGDRAEPRVAAVRLEPPEPAFTDAPALGPESAPEPAFAAGRTPVPPRAADRTFVGGPGLSFAAADPDPAFAAPELAPSAGSAADTWAATPLRAVPTAEPTFAPAAAEGAGDEDGEDGGPEAAISVEVDLASERPTPEVRLRRAPSWKRVAAWVVDLAPFTLLAGWIVRAAIGPAERQALGTADGALDLLAHEASVLGSLVAFLALAAAVYFTLAHALMGASIGKWVLGLRVVDGRGRRPSPARCAVRAAFSIVGVGVVGLGVLLALFNRSGRALHDLVAGTTVVERP